MRSRLISGRAAARLIPLILLLPFMAFPDRHVSARPPVIVFFGDSLTAGLHASQPDRAYRQIVMQRLRGTADAGPSYSFIQDPYGLLDDAQSKLPLVLAARPTLIFLELGHHETWSTESEVAKFESRYATILDRLLLSGADIVPTTLAWLAYQPGTFSYDAALRINETIRKLATARGLVVADLWTATVMRPELLSRPEDRSFVEPYRGDGLHPNDLGHLVLADAVWEAYRSMRQASTVARRPV